MPQNCWVSIAFWPFAGSSWAAVLSRLRRATRLFQVGASGMVVVASQGGDVDGCVIERVNDPIPPGEASGPEAGEMVSQGFRFACAHHGVVAADALLEDLSGGVVQLAVFSVHGFIRLPAPVLKYR